MRSLLTVDDLPPSVHATILERAEGNPFYIEEIVRRLIDEGAVVADGRPMARHGHRRDDRDPRHGAGGARGAHRSARPGGQAGRAGRGRGRPRLLAGPGRRAHRARAVGDPRRGCDTPRTASSCARSSARRSRASRSTSSSTSSRATSPTGRSPAAIARTRTARWRTGCSAAPESECPSSPSCSPTTSAPRRISRPRRARSTTTFGSRRCAGSGPRRTPRVDGSPCARRSGSRRRRSRSPRPTCSGRSRSRPSGAAHFDGYAGDPGVRRAGRRRCDVRVRGVPEDGRSIARLAGLACELPIRWPGSMKERLPDETTVQALMDLGFANLPPGDGEERIRLLSLRSGWLFAFPNEHVTEAEMEAFERAGIEASEIAARLGLWDLASGALDLAGASRCSVGRYGAAKALHELRRSGDAARDEPAWRSGTSTRWGSGSTWSSGATRTRSGTATEALARDRRARPERRDPRAQPGSPPPCGWPADGTNRSRRPPPSRSCSATNAMTRPTSPCIRSVRPP